MVINAQILVFAAVYEANGTFIYCFMMSSPKQLNNDIEDFAWHKF